MDYTQLKKGINYFAGKFPPNRKSQYKYSTLRQRELITPGYWLHLQRMTPQQLAVEIIDGFLNTRGWNCHIPASHSPNCNPSGHCSKTCKRSQVANNLKTAVNSLPTYYANIQGTPGATIENANFQNIRQEIDSIYSAFLGIRPSFGRVAASKLMHMALPDLFVMWDNGIIEAYSIPKQRLAKKKNRSYVAFLILMQENILHAIQSHPQAPVLTKEKIVQNVCSAYGNLSLPRLLDMANFAMRDDEQGVCIDCMNKAKSRWAQLGL